MGLVKLKRNMNLKTQVNNWLMFVVIFVAVVLAGLYFYDDIKDICLWFCERPIDSDVTPGPEIDVNKISPIHLTDFSDDRKLAGASHNVFVARILKQAGHESLISGIPATQFEGEVVYNIKGNLEDTVLINQLGGYKNGIFNIVGDFESKDYLLKPGNTYLVATRFSESKNRHTLHSHPNSFHLINEYSPDNSLVERFKDAYRNEIILEIDSRGGSGE